MMLVKYIYKIERKSNCLQNVVPNQCAPLMQGMIVGVSVNVVTPKTAHSNVIYHSIYHILSK